MKTFIESKKIEEELISIISKKPKSIKKKTSAFDFITIVWTKNLTDQFKRRRNESIDISQACKVI